MSTAKFEFMGVIPPSDDCALAEIGIKRTDKERECVLKVRIHRDVLICDLIGEAIDMKRVSTCIRPRSSKVTTTLSGPPVKWYSGEVPDVPKPMQSSSLLGVRHEQVMYRPLPPSHEWPLASVE